MPDWDRIVQEKLPKLNLARAREAEIREELVAHFSEMYAEFLEKTSSEEEAMRKVLAEIGDWRALARQIRITELIGSLNLRVRTLWLPGLMGTVAVPLGGMVAFMLFRRMPDQSVAFLNKIEHLGLAAVFFGLLLLPSGFLSSGVAWYLGASGVRRVCSALFPMAALWISIIFVELWVGDPLRTVLAVQLRLIPCAALGLLAGGLPFFLRRQKLSFPLGRRLTK
jgi:hypothetical protein